MFRLKLCKLVLNTTHVILGQTRLLSISNKSCYFCPTLNTQQTLFQWPLEVSKCMANNCYQRLKCVPYVQHNLLNCFHCFCTSTIKIVPVQTILYQFKVFCPSSKTNCSKVKNYNISKCKYKWIALRVLYNAKLLVSLLGRAFKVMKNMEFIL